MPPPERVNPAGGSGSGVVIETERLLLRPLTTQDLDFFVQLHSDPEVTRYVPAFTREQAVERLAEIERQWAERGHGLCAVESKETGELIGRCGLNYWEVFDEVEAGWTFRRACWGRGYATEAARAVVDWGFARLDVDHLTAMIVHGNAASVRVAERLGFVPGREDTFLGKPVTVHMLHRNDQRPGHQSTDHLEG
ncbi:GNAT family N-acetyltransferase [Streptomyces oryzae]|uniref:GNAT family N-acetyltransferase n=1 Tax=Streptomyces oryzae TaxID=1434886 RepID=A0ABS3XEZ5_9ACTN|nr:GNAT family N-acetyltransferase [Streptomyces oryzae]MBO8193967.1 GNAT family N-acetyltransferase [Streptomyces oryzae]